MDTPIRITNFTEFSRTFGDSSAVSDMARHIRMFFGNGGSDTYVMRIADNAQQAEVTLLAEDGAALLTARAKSAGASGEQLRVIVSIPVEEPESRFNLRVYRWAPNWAGLIVATETESYQNLTMDADDPLCALDNVSQEFALIGLEDEGDACIDAQDGFSLGGRVIPLNAALNDFQPTPVTIFNGDAGQPGGTHLRISVDGNPYITADLSALPAAIATTGAVNRTDLRDEVLAAIREGIIQAYNNQAGIPGVVVTLTWRMGAAQIGGEDVGFIKIASTNDGAIRVRPATAGKNLALLLMLGPGQGGVEVGAHGHQRPQPNGIQIRVSDLARYNAYAFSKKEDLISIIVAGFDADGNPVPRPIGLPLYTAVTGTDPVNLDTYGAAGAMTGNSDGISQQIARIRDGINADNDAKPRLNPWRAAQAATRLSISSASAEDLA